MPWRSRSALDDAAPVGVGEPGVVLAVGSSPENEHALVDRSTTVSATARR